VTRARLALAVLATALVAGCTFPPLETRTPTPSPRSSQPTPSPTATPSATAEPSASTQPDPSTIPAFNGGEIVTTTFAGLRVRDLPGTDRRVVTDLLGFDAELEVLMGPIVADELGWYLVRDADPDAPEFEEGWVAAGYEPDANVRSTGRVADETPVIVALSQVGEAQHGPIEVPDEHHIIRWAAVDPEGVRCQFAIMLAAGSAAPVPAIRATVGDALIPGTLPSSFFVAQPTLRGQLFLTAETDCAWTLAVMREETPEPLPTSSP
jgi:hypothetical protein